MIGDIGASLAGSLGSSLSGGLGGSLSGGLGASAAGAANLAASANLSAGLTSGLSASVSAPGGGPARPPDIWPAFRFIVQIDGCGPLRFQSVGGDSGGITATMHDPPPAAPPHPGAPAPGGGSGSGKPASPVHVAEAGKDTTTQLPNRSWTVENIKLTRGMAADGKRLWDWLKKAGKGDYDPREVTVIVLDEEGQMAMTWNFHKTYPTQWKMPLFSAKEPALSIEEISLAVQGVDVEFG